jgi:hypothetical protein
MVCIEKIHFPYPALNCDESLALHHRQLPEQEESNLQYDEGGRDREGYGQQ